MVGQIWMGKWGAEGADLGEIGSRGRKSAAPRALTLNFEHAAGGRPQFNLQLQTVAWRRFCPDTAIDRSDSCAT